MPSPETLSTAKPELVADVWLYPTDQGGRRSAIQLGWGCPCKESPEMRQAWDVRPLLQAPLGPGERRRLGFVCLTAEGAQTLAAAGKFYLWEGRIIGEAVVVTAETAAAAAPPSERA